MDINVLWEQIRPTVMTSAQAILIAIFTVIIPKIAGSAVGKKLTAFKGEISSATLQKNIADDIVKKLGKSSINVDLTAIAKKEIDAGLNTIKEKMFAVIDTQYAELQEQFASIKKMTAGLADILVRSKEMSAQAREAVLAEIIKERGEIVEEEKEVIKINLIEEPESEPAKEEKIAKYRAIG